MIKLTYSLLKKKINENDLDNLYIFYGENIFLMKKFSKMIIDKSLGDNINSFNFISFSEEIDIQKFNLAVNTFPIFGDKKIILFKKIRLQNFISNDLKYFFEIISNVPKFSILILEFLENDDKKNNQFEKIIKSYLKIGSLMEFTEISDLKLLEKQIILWAKEFDKIISLPQAKLILERCENKMFEIFKAVKQICTIDSKSREITNNDIINVLKFSNENYRIFDVVKFLHTKDTKKTLTILQNLLIEEEPISILYVLSSYFIDIYRVKLGLRYKKNLDTISVDFNYNKRSFILKNIMNNFKNTSEKSIKTCLKLLIETEKLSKTSSIPIKYLIEELIIKIIKLL